MSDRDSVRQASLNENPLKAKLSPQQFDAACRFYDADQELTPKDRDDIADQLKPVLKKTSFISYGLATVGFFTPTIYYHFWGPKYPPTIVPTNDGGFKKVPNPLNSMIRRPFLGFFIGLATLLVLAQVVGKYTFNNKRESITDPVERRVWDSMDYRQAGMFYMYYKRTAVDALYQVRDPRGFTRENVHEGITKGGEHFANALHPKVPSQWDMIRANAGVDVTQTSRPKNQDN